MLSPGNAPDELLARFPPTHVLVGDIDPMLDDAVAFTRRLLSVKSVVFVLVFVLVFLHV